MLLLFTYLSSLSASPGCVGADVPEAEAGDGEGEATSRAGALQEVSDAATDTLATRRPLQGLPPQVTPTRRADGPFRLTPRVYFSWPGPRVSMEENMAGLDGRMDEWSEWRDEG